VASASTFLDKPAAVLLIDENSHAVILDSYLTIDDQAFKRTNLTSVVIPNTITHIGMDALKTLILPLL